MTKCIFAVLVILVTIGLAPCAAAQSEAGQQEISFLASFSDVGGEGDGNLSATARYGLFLTDAILVGGGLTVAGPIDDLDQLLLAEVFGTYYFSPAEVNTFYARGGLLFLVDDPGEGFIEGAGGYRSYLNENAAVFVELALGAPIGDADSSARLVAGLSYLF
jgi:hypothetical protein